MLRNFSQHPYYSSIRMIQDNHYNSLKSHISNFIFDLYLSGDAKFGEIRFWTSMALSLTIGLMAAYPVNVLLIKWGVKEGMHDPRMSH